MKIILLLILLFTNLAFALPQKGIAVIVDDVNLKKTSDLIDKTDLTLFLQFSDEKNANVARESAFMKKLLGKRVFINCVKNSIGRLHIAVPLKNTFFSINRAKKILLKRY